MRLYRGLPLLMWLLLASYLIGLANHSGTDFEPLVDGWLGLLTTIVPAIVCWSAVRTAGQRRREVTCLAVGVSIWAVGATMIVSAAWAGVLVPFPSPADLAYLCFYPAMLAALVLAAHREHRDLRGAVWLDSLLGALAAAAALAVLLAPLFSQASGRPLDIAVAVAYPAFDLLLVAVVVGIVALQGSSLPRHWVPLLTGLMLFAAADIVYALRVNADNYVIGTPVDVLWAAGLALMSVWARNGSPSARPEQVRPEQPLALAVPALATITGLGVLIAASRTDVSALALALATARLLVAGLRTQLAFQQLRRLAEFRRQAGTDDLTGLPNRRAFSRLANAALGASDRPHALLLLDLDRFKEVNDSLGHQAGDALLVQVGARFAAQLRDGDMIGAPVATSSPSWSRGATRRRRWRSSCEAVFANRSWWAGLRSAVTSASACRWHPSTAAS